MSQLKVAYARGEMGDIAGQEAPDYTSKLVSLESLAGERAMIGGRALPSANFGCSSRAPGPVSEPEPRRCSCRIGYASRLLAAWAVASGFAAAPSSAAEDELMQRAQEVFQSIPELRSRQR